MDKCLFFPHSIGGNKNDKKKIPLLHSFQQISWYTEWVKKNQNSHLFDNNFKGLQARENQKAPQNSLVFLCIHIQKLN